MAKYKHVNENFSVRVNFDLLLEHAEELQAWLRDYARKSATEQAEGDELDEINEQIDRLDDAISEAVGSLENDGRDAAEFVNEYV